jgi:hypothetical protein
VGGTEHGPAPSGLLRFRSRRLDPAARVDRCTNQRRNRLCFPRWINSWNADGILPLDGVITSEDWINAIAPANREEIRRQYPGVVDVALGLAYRRAWTRENQTIEIVPVDDYAIIVTFAEQSQCPAMPATIDGAPIFFRHL